MVEVDGLLKEIEGAFFHGGDGFFDGTEGGERRTGMVESACLVSRRTSRPEAPGIFRSVMTRR